MRNINSVKKSAIHYSLVLLVGLALSNTYSKPLPVRVDVEDTGDPIHPFVYGQFIEHLGRCIYGGIWAEMLEDRKFYFPITPRYNPYGDASGDAYPVVSASPWQIIGPANGVVMIAADSFVGDHTPLVREGSGIRQRDLGLVAGKAYVGYFWAKSASSEITVGFGDGDDKNTVSFAVDGNEYRKYEYTFIAREDSLEGVLEITVDKGEAMIGTVSLMPADNIRGMRKDTLDLLKELNAPIYRWPGGNFVSGYEWRDGIGDRDRRPPRRNPAWTGVEHNDFGTDEFIDFCREIRTEPAIAVNTGFGDPYSAAEWVSYCNGRSDSYPGGLRASNGHQEPFDVEYWCVGNEMFGTWQLGYMQLHHYTEKHNRTARAMRERDPSITLIGVGAIGGINKEHDPTAAAQNRGWSRGMLEDCAENMTWISEHFYSGRVPWTDEGELPLVEHVQLLKNNIRKIVAQHRELQASLENLDGRTIPIAMDEWNYWHREYEYGELGCVYDLGDALGVAAGLHEYFRHSDIIAMANYAQTVNVIGCIKTSKTAAEFATTGLVLKLYREVFGEIPLNVEGGLEPHDLCAALREDGSAITIGVINPTNEALDLEVDFGSARLSDKGDHYLITGPARAAHNRPGKSRTVDIELLKEVKVSDRFSVPPLSANIFVVPLR